jgi:hypothetical protein
VRGGEAVEGLVIGRVNGDELALQMGRELGDRDAVTAGDALHLVAIGVALGGLGEIEQARIPGRHLDALIAQRRGPGADGIERVERRLVAGELGEENRGTFHGAHRCLE